ncbi:MAG TPA: hypothetical protein VH144_00700 [Candidatus Saccharimonadales bacterium]|nr:hypothetical protein [Candidatus Saccharimonadales bacterium]
MAKQATVIEKPPVYIGSSWRDILQVFGVGLAAGLLIKLLTFVLKQYFIQPVFCRTTDTFGVCSQGDQVAFGIATVVISLVAVVVLARINVFRPLLVVVATAAALWGAIGYLPVVATYASPLEQALWLMLLYGIGYVVFSWLMRLRNFAASLVVAIVVVVGLRFLLIY